MHWPEIILVHFDLLISANIFDTLNYCVKLPKNTYHTMWDVCTIDWPKEDAANFESQNFEGP